MKKITEALGVPRTRNFGNFSGGNLAQGPLPRSEQTADNGSDRGYHLVWRTRPGLPGTVLATALEQFIDPPTTALPGRRTHTFARGLRRAWQRKPSVRDGGHHRHH